MVETPQIAQALLLWPDSCQKQGGAMVSGEPSSLVGNDPNRGLGWLRPRMLETRGFPASSMFSAQVWPFLETSNLPTHLNPFVQLLYLVSAQMARTVPENGLMSLLV